MAVGRALGTVVVTVHGELDLDGGELLGKLLADLIDGQGNRTVAVDLADATVAAGVLVVFVAAAQRARSLGARFLLTGTSAEVHDALQTFGLGHLIDIERQARGRNTPLVTDERERNRTRP